MGRITPSNRGETAVAWGLGIAGSIYGLIDECSLQLGGELVTKSLERTRAATHKWLAAHEVDLSAVTSTPPVERLPNVTPLHVGAEAVGAEIAVLPLREELPLQAA